MTIGINFDEAITEDISQPIETSETVEGIPKMDVANGTDSVSITTSDTGTGNEGPSGVEIQPSENGNEVKTKTQTTELSGEIYNCGKSAKLVVDTRGKADGNKNECR